MKKILGILMAAVMAMTLAGCSSEKHDYQKDADDLSKFAVAANERASYINDASAAARGYLEAFVQLSYDVDSADDPDKLISVKNQFIKKGNEYLAKIDRLNPPDNEKLFHNKLLEWVDIARELNNNLSDMCGSVNDENRFNEASSRFDSSTAKLDSKTNELANSSDWFKQAVEKYL